MHMIIFCLICYEQQLIISHLLFCFYLGMPKEYTSSSLNSASYEDF